MWQQILGGILTNGATAVQPVKVEETNDNKEMLIMYAFGALVLVIFVYFISKLIK